MSQNHKYPSAEGGCFDEEYTDVKRPLKVRSQDGDKFVNQIFYFVIYSFTGVKLKLSCLFGQNLAKTAEIKSDLEFLAS